MKTEREKRRLKAYRKDLGTSIHGECFRAGQAGQCRTDDCDIFAAGDCEYYEDVDDSNQDT